MQTTSTTVTLDDTQANQEMFPQSRSQKKGVGFPIVMMVVIQSLVTGMIEAMNFGPLQGKESGEMALARSIMGTLKSGDLLLGDRYYPSYFLISMLLNEGIHGVFQSHGARKVDFKTGVSLGVKDHLSTWIKPKRPAYMSEEAYSEFPDSITVRELDVTEEFDSKDSVILTTTLLDSEKYSKQALAELYRERWKIEVALRDIKITMGMDHIASKSPEIVEKIIWSKILGYNFVRWYIANAAKVAAIKIENISVAATLAILMANLQNLTTATKSQLTKIRASMLYQMIQCQVGLRKGRHEPRAVKRRPKKNRYLKGPRSLYSSKACAASKPGEIAPPASLRTEREPLDSLRSYLHRCSHSQWAKSLGCRAKTPLRKLYEFSLLFLSFLNLRRAHPARMSFRNLQYGITAVL